MAESSAKSIDESAGECREQFGAQVIVSNAQCTAFPAAPDKRDLFGHTAWPSAQPVSTGRGANWFVDSDCDHFVLRHFRRGGAVAWLLGNKYWFSGEDATRSIAEFRLLKKLHDLDLPVPEPVAAGYCKQGPWYTAQLLTRRIPDAHSWSEGLIKSPHQNQYWTSVGRTVARLHRARVDHADLNAHNILVDGAGQVSIIDFDKGLQRDSMGGGWQGANLARLKRSLYKILPSNRALVEQGWPQLLNAYEHELGN